ncbi:MAG: DnaJ domain-containing protein [Hyphomicrobiales bacterium]
MIQFFAGALLLAIVYLGLRLFSRSEPKALAKLFRQLLAVGAFVAAIILVFTSRYAVLSLPVGLVGLGLLLGWRWPFKRGAGSNAGAGKTSSVNTDYFEMTLNHQTGQMDGRIKKGDHEDDRLSNLSPEQLKVLYEEVLDQGDPNSLSLLEAYLDGVIATWREDFEVDADTRHRRTSGSGTITEEEAYEILGLAPGAGRDSIVAAHRRLMMKIHPDRGGSTALAAKINEAKDFLLSNHSSTS